MLEGLQLTTPTATPPAEVPRETTEAPVEPNPPVDDRSMLEKVPKAPSPKARENFAKLEENLKQEAELRKAAEARVKEFEQREATLKAETETTQSRIKELEQKLSIANPEEFTVKEQKYQQELEKLREEFKLVALERDPDFISRFDTPKVHLHAKLQDMAALIQVSNEDFQRAVKLGQEDKLWEIRESLPDQLKPKWDAARIQIEQVDLQRELALKNKDQTYQEMTQKRQAEYQSQLAQKAQQNIALARQIALEPFEKMPFLKDNAELQSQVRRNVEALAGGEGADQFSVERILRDQAAFTVNQHILELQSQALQSKDTQIQELQAKLKEREDFIQQRHGSLPNNEVNPNEQKEAAKARPLWEEVKEMTGGGRNAFI